MSRVRGNLVLNLSAKQVMHMQMDAKRTALLVTAPGCAGFADAEAWDQVIRHERRVGGHCDTDLWMDA